MNEIKPYLIKLTATPEHINNADIKNIIKLLVEDKVTEAQTGALLTLLKTTELDKKPEIVQSFVNNLLNFSDKVEFKDGGLASIIVDIVGTGGDNFNTFNVSTASAIVVSGCQVKVAKHGNKSSTSNSGSSDFLEALDLNIEKVDSSNVEKILTESNFCFLFASKFHKSWGKVSATRKQLGFPTLFNFLGPLVNPCKPKSMVVGVNRKELGSLMTETLKLLGVNRAFVVNGCEGLDEFSIAGDTQVWELKDGEISQYLVNPTKDFGLPCHSLDKVKGDSASSNAEIFLKILSNEIVDHPILDFILLNSAALLKVCGKAFTFKDGVQLARNSIVSGHALEQLILSKSFLESL